MSELETKVQTLNRTTNNLAEIIKTIKDDMVGKGVSPAKAPLVIAKLDEVETRLRQIGSQGNLLVPDDTRVKSILEEGRLV